MRFLQVCLFAAVALITGWATPPSTPPKVAHADSSLLVTEEAALGAFYEVRVYIVTRGDTVAKIARSSDVSIQHLRLLNPELDPTRIRVGQQIRVSERRVE